MSKEADHAAACLNLARSFAPEGEKRRWCDCLHHCIGRNVDRGGIVRSQCQGLPSPPPSRGGRV